MEIGIRIEEARRRRGWNQTDLGKAVGLKQGRISELERGHGEPTASQVVAIAEVTGVSADFLLYGRESPPAALTADQAFVLGVLEATGLNREEATQALLQAARGRRVVSSEARVLATSQEAPETLPEERPKPLSDPFQKPFPKTSPLKGGEGIIGKDIP